MRNCAVCLIKLLWKILKQMHKKKKYSVEKLAEIKTDTISGHKTSWHEIRIRSWSHNHESNKF